MTGPGSQREQGAAGERWRRPSVCLPLLLLAACGRLGFGLSALDAGRSQPTDAGTRDAGAVSTVVADAGHDAGMLDSGLLDAGTDAGAPDSGEVDAGVSHVNALARGFGHMCAIVDGTLWCWGLNDNGQLGQGDTTNRQRPAVVPGSWISACGGETFSCGIQQGGELYCWGGNAKGQLGVGDLDSRTSPAHVVGLHNWKQVSCIGAFACALRGSGDLYCWGENLEGATGQNDMNGAPDLTTPKPVAADAVFRQVSAAQGDACALRTDGTLFCWGRNTDMQLGLGANAPARARGPVQVGTDTGWVALGAGQQHTCAIRADGGLWCWGSTAGALGATPPNSAMFETLPTRVGTMSDWSQVSSSRIDACAVTRGGALYCWGRDIEGQLGDGKTTNSTTPVRAGTDSDWQEVATGFFCACGRRADNSIWCWGANDSGELGLGDTNRRSMPTKLTFP